MIRKASVEDLPAVLQLEKMCFENNAYNDEQILWLLRDGNHNIFLFIEDGHAIGALMLSYHRKRGKVVSVGVHPDWRKRGIGRKLMKWGEKHLMDAGVRRLDLEVWVGNHDAISFYRTLGYEIATTLKGYYSGRMDAYLMSKKLS